MATISWQLYIHERELYVNKTGHELRFAHWRMLPFDYERWGRGRGQEVHQGKVHVREGIQRQFGRISGKDLKGATKPNLCLNQITRRQIPTISTFQALFISYTLLNPLAFLRTTSSVHDNNSRQRQRTEGVLALSLANRIHLPSAPSLPITLSDRLCGGIREHVTHVWAAHTSSPALENASTTVIAKFYDPLYLHDEYESVDPLRLAAQSVPNEVKAYEMLQSFQGICIPRCLGLYATVIPEQDGRTVYVLLLELVAGKDLRYLCEDVEREEIVADYLCEQHCEAIFATLFRLMMDFMDLGVLQDNLAPRNVIIRPPAHPGPFCSDERCPARFEIDTDDVRAVMVDFERVRIEYPPDPDTVSLFGRLFANADVKDYFASWFRNICAYPDYNG